MREVKMAGNWLTYFFCVIMNREEVEVYKTQQKNDGQIFSAQIAN